MSEPSWFRRTYRRIINATFIERLVDYGVVFKNVQELVTKYSDANHKVYVAQPRTKALH